MRYLQKNKGFTLTELVVTTSIMGILAAVAVPSYLETQTRAKSEKTMANISAFGTELGKNFNELASEFGRVQLANGATGTAVVGTAGAAAVAIVDDGFILISGASSGDASLVGDSRTWLDLFPGGVYKSPYADRDYDMEVLNPGSVSYTADASGNVQPVVVKASLRITDPEDPGFLKATFAY